MGVELIGATGEKRRGIGSVALEYGYFCRAEGAGYGLFANGRVRWFHCVL